MRKIMLLAFSLALILGLGAAAQADDAKVLNVAIFGYVPDGSAVCDRLSIEFEKLKTGYKLQVTLLDPYHNSDQGMTSLKHFKEFDVVETDMCRFDDLQSAKFGGLDAMPIEWKWRPKAGECVGPAHVVMGAADQTGYMIPHWICGNFMVFWADNERMKNANSFDDILGALEPKDRPLLADLWGKTGLGEFYAKALVDLYGAPKAAENLTALAASASPQLDPAAEAAVKKLADGLPEECRKHLSFFDDHFENYGWGFAGNKRAVYLGYSEGLFNASLARALHDGPPGNFTGGEIVIRQLSLSAHSQGTPSWCDAFVIPKGKLEAKKAAVEAFLKLIRSDVGYLCWEEPEENFAEANLLPAYANTYDNAELKRVAPLLAQFRENLSDNFVINHSVLWNGMHAAGEILEGELSH